MVMSHGNINKPHPFQLTNIELMNYEFHLGIIGCVVTCLTCMCTHRIHVIMFIYNVYSIIQSIITRFNL